MLSLEAANRDGAAFACPHSLQAGRQPNPHVAFGFGPHRCPGASVARIEIAVALQALLETLAGIGRHPSQPPRLGSESEHRRMHVLPLPLRLIPDPGKRKKPPHAW